MLLISTPASVVIAKIMVPEREEVTDGVLLPDTNIRSSMDAITQGTVQGEQLLINIVAMIIVMVSLIT